MGRETVKFLGAAVFAAASIVSIPIPGVNFALQMAGAAVFNNHRRRGGAQRQEGIRQNIATTTAPIPVVYGTSKIGIRPVFVRVDPNSTDKEDLYIVGALCHGEINDIEEVYFDEKLAVDNAVVDAFFTGNLSYDDEVGTSAQTVMSLINTPFPTEWDANHRGRGIAYVGLKLTYDKDVYLGGIPNITCVIEGKLVYDPRDTNTKFSDNPALCIRDYLTNTTYGGGLTAAEINDASFIAIANYCDELVPIPDAGCETPPCTQKRYTCNGWVDTGRPIQENLQELLSSCRGVLIYQEGEFRLHIPRVLSAEVFELDESNIIGDWQFRTGGVDQVANIVHATFMDIDADRKPNQTQWPEVGAANSFLTADNDFESTRDIELPFTENVYMARRIAMTALKESRQDISVALTAKEEAKELQVGEIVKVSHEYPGWVEKQFWVWAMSLLQDGNVRPLLREYDPSAYSLSTLSDADAIPDTNLPDPFTVPAPTVLTLTSDATTVSNPGEGASIPRIKVEWTKPADKFSDYIEVFARKQGDAEWDKKGRVDERDDQIIFIEGVNATDTWEVGVQSVNKLGKRSTLVTDTVVISSGAFANPRPDDVSAVTLLLEADDLDVEFSDGEKEIEWMLVKLSLSTTYVKNSRFRFFEYKIYSDLDDPDEVNIKTSVGDSLGSNIYAIAELQMRIFDDRGATWTAEVRVRNLDNQVSENFVSDSIAYVKDALLINAEGARLGKVAILPDGKINPNFQHDNVQKKARTLFSGDGAPTGQSGPTGSGDSLKITDQEVTLNIGDDEQKLSAGATEDTITPTGNLGENVGQITGGETRKLARGSQGLTSKDGDSIVFDPSYNDIPTVIFTPKGFVPYDPNDNLTWDNGYTVDQNQYLEIEPLNLTAAGFTMRARLRQKGVQTARGDDFASGAGRILDTIGQTREANLDPAVAAGDLYTIHFKVDLEAENDFFNPVDATLVIAIDSNDGGGWVERLTIPYSLYSEISPESNEWPHEEKQITVSGLALNDDIRLRMKSESRGPKTEWVKMEVTCFNKDTDADPENGVTYTTATDSVASATPNAEDGVPWEAFEVT